MPKLTAKQLDSITEFGKYEDGNGLRLIVRASGKTWVFRYQRAGKRREMGLGAYPQIGLKDARTKAEGQRSIIRSGIDPLTKSRDDEAQSKEALLTAARRAQNTLKFCALEYIEAHRPGWKSAKHAQQWHNTLTTYVFPFIGEKAIDEIDVDAVLQVLAPIWLTIPETSKRVRSRLELILDYAKAKKLRVGENPARWRGHLEKLLPSGRNHQQVRHHPAMPWSEAPSFIKKLQSIYTDGSRLLEFVILTAVRTSEALNATWDEFDLKQAVWTIPADRMKAGVSQRVPLPPRVIEILDQQRKTGAALVFQGRKQGRSISNMTGLMLLRRMKLGHFTVHGFRSTFRDWCAEATSFPSEVAEMALAHTIENRVEAAYRRGDLFVRRSAMMNEWAEYLTSEADKSRAQVDHTLSETPSMSADLIAHHNP
ncbi:integrase arm-type DNA-binding domain-containing protein [Pseudomonas sp.]|uniref:tyrosine-type recombinase/integrase n=1 Tax=Pseudomonas sp. TaxID=306 RepID=UPI0032630D64